MMKKLGIPQPDQHASNLAEALDIARKIGYPLMVRPSYGLGDAPWKWCWMKACSKNMWLLLWTSRRKDRSSSTNFSKRYRGRGRCDADGTDAFYRLSWSISSLPESIQRSACVIPPVSIPPKHIETIYEYTKRIAIELNVVGLMNIQYAIANDTCIYLRQPKGSRTVPLSQRYATSHGAVCNAGHARQKTDGTCLERSRFLILASKRLSSRLICSGS